MENTTTTTKTTSRGAAISALAIVGFIVLIIIGIVLAIYTARHMPKFASKLNGASVSLSSIFHPNDENKPALQVVTATSTLPFGITSSTTTSATTSVVSAGSAATDVPHASSANTGAHYAGQTTYTTVVTNQPVAPYGTPDLSVNVTDVGYLSRGGDTSSFVGADSVPFGNNAAVKFTIKNTGTNITGLWNFSADIPISPAQHFVAPMQASLNPGESADFVLGFDRGYSSGQRITITVVADPSNYINETTKNNNVSSRWIVIQ